MLHALVALGPESTFRAHQQTGDSSIDDESLPVTSRLCQWKAPRKSKESNQKLMDIVFEKHTYGRTKKHEWKPIKDFDPQPNEYRGMAPGNMEEFLKKSQGKRS